MAPRPRDQQPGGTPLQPIAPERHVLRVTVGTAFVADLEDQWSRRAGKCALVLRVGHG